MDLGGGTVRPVDPTPPPKRDGCARPAEALRLVYAPKLNSFEQIVNNNALTIFFTLKPLTLSSMSDTIK